MANFSTLEALTTLSTSIPDWNLQLDKLNSQIALRQVELARLTDERPPTRSIKNKGSTESLRPHDEDEEVKNGLSKVEDSHYISNHYPTPPNTRHNGNGNGNGLKRTNSSAAARAAAVITPPLSQDSPNPRPSPTALNRQSSQPTPPTAPRLGLRKRKTDSIASAESHIPKYRTRSMIIVYYDSAVQTAFEDLVKFVSGSRNSMRKGKMNAKMAAMRKAAEREVDDDTDEDDILNSMLTTRGTLMRVHKDPVVSTKSQIPGNPLLMEADSDDVDMVMPQLRFVSTRNMGPPRALSGNRDGNRISTDMLGAQRGKTGVLEGDIFDELDKGLEWCQGQCERAAHQFLRDGDCNDEIEGIKKRLSEVKQISEREIERLKSEEAAQPRKVPDPHQTTKSRQFKSPHQRHDLNPQRGMEVDTMEVDDSEVDDVDLMAKLAFKRTRDYR